MQVTVASLCSRLAESRLMTPDEVQSMHQRWLAEAKGSADNSERFTEWLTANRYVTEYQAKLLLRGHTENFFLDQYKILDRFRWTKP